MKHQETIINILFDPKRGNSRILSREGVSGRAFGELPRATRPGYAFKGWYLGDTLITPETVISGEEDIILTARWERVRNEGVRSMYQKQRLAVVILAALAVLLVATLLIVKEVVSVYRFTDTYYTADGTEVSDEYTVKKVDGVYTILDKDGNRMSTNQYGYYILKSGNQYDLDAETGAYELYAVVDDNVRGELMGYGNRVLIFPQIEQKNVYSIKVNNESGSYRFYREKDGTVVIEGTEDALVSYDKEVYASMVVACGYTLTTHKLDLSRADVPRKADGSINYAAYGLDAPQASYTITAAARNEKGELYESETSYTVYVGDMTLDGAGYYVQIEGKDAVYVLDNSLKSTVLQPVESMVTPMIVYPATVSTYVMAYDFFLGKGNLDNGVDNLDTIVAFSFEELEARINSIYTTTPYVPLIELMKGYKIHDNNISALLANMYEMEFIACRKLGITKEALAEYGLDGECYYMAYTITSTDDDGNYVYVGPESDPPQILMISEKTEQGTYYVASMLTDMIVEVDAYYFNFLEWKDTDWYEESLISYNLAYIDRLSVQVGDEAYDFTMNNDLSYHFYITTDEDDPTKKIGLVPDIEQGSIKKRVNDGVESYVYVVDGVQYPLYAVDFSTRDNFRQDGNDVTYVTVIAGETVEVDLSLNSSNMRVYCKQYTENEDGLLNYVKIYTYLTDTGVERSKYYSALDNFSKLYKSMMYYSIEGNLDHAEFEAAMGMSAKDYIAKGDGVCDAIIRLHLKDYASKWNFYKNDKDEYIWTEDNELDLVIRFYNYTGRKAMVTIEVVENGVSDPTKVEATFYVLSSYMDTILANCRAVIAGDYIKD